MHGSALRLVGWQRQARVDRCLGPSLISSAVDLVWQTDVQVIAASRPTWGDRVPVPVQLTVSWSIRGDRIADLVAPYCVAIAADRTAAATPGTPGVLVVTPSRTASIAFFSSVMVVSVVLSHRRRSVPVAGHPMT